MQKWEYVLVTCAPRANTITADIGPHLTPGATLATYRQQIGSDGWDLTGVANESDGVTALLFKRPLAPTSPSAYWARCVARLAVEGAAALPSGPGRA